MVATFIDNHLVMVLLTIGGILLASQQVAGLQKDFKAILELAKTLDSAEMLAHQDTKSQAADKRDEVLFHFAREIKSDLCAASQETVTNIVEQFRKRAYDAIEHGKRNPNWFDFLKIGSPIFHMRALTRFVPTLTSLVERYEQQTKTGVLTRIDVDCDMIKTKIKHLHDIMFTLTADIKSLVLEDQRTLNRAIFDRLRQDKLEVSSNVYTISEVSKALRDHLEKFFRVNVDIAEVNVGQSIDHFIDPSEFIVGRMIDTCHAANQYSQVWQAEKSAYNGVCTKSEADPNGHLFETSFPFDMYDETFAFCEHFLESI